MAAGSKDGVLQSRENVLDDHLITSLIASPWCTVAGTAGLQVQVQYAIAGDTTGDGCQRRLTKSQHCSHTSRLAPAHSTYWPHSAHDQSRLGLAGPQNPLCPFVLWSPTGSHPLEKPAVSFPFLPVCWARNRVPAPALWGTLAPACPIACPIASPTAPGQTSLASHASPPGAGGGLCYVQKSTRSSSQDSN